MGGNPLRSVWCCPSRGRPHNIERLVIAWEDTQASCVLDLRLDEDDPELDRYMQIQFPDLWAVTVGPRATGAEYTNETLDRYPQASAYGCLGDDCVPKTRHWDRLLASAAGDWGIAYADDLWKSRCTHPIIGGELVRAVGWLGLPVVNSLCIDTAWEIIGQEISRLVFCPAVIIEHMHPCAGKAPRDRTYNERRGGRDLRTFDKWRHSEEYRQLIGMIDEKHRSWKSPS